MNQDGAALRWAPWRAAAILIPLAILFARKSFALTHPQFWAEDAAIFFDQAYRWGVGSLFRPYGGYLHLYPRCVALLGGQFDPALAPLLYNTVAWLTAGVVLGMFVSPRVGLPPWVGLSLAVIPTLLPHSGEVFCNLTNVQWFTWLVLLVTLLKTPPASGAVFGCELGMLGLVGLTGPFSVLFFPAFAYRAWRERNRYAVLAALIVGATALVQAAFLLTQTAGHPTSVAAGWPGTLAQVFADRLIVQTFFASFGQPPVAVVWLVTIGVLALAGWAAVCCGGRREVQITLPAVGLLVPLAMLARFRGILPMFSSYENGDRYFFFSRMCVVYVVLLCVAGRWPRRAWLLAVPGCAIAVTLAGHFAGRPWPNLEWRRYCGDIRAGRPVTVPINPVPWTYPFPGRNAPR